MTSKTQQTYDASDIEVLTGLEPVRRRPGMYTDTSRPDHLAQEVIDNSVDEAVAGYARRIEVTLHADGSLSVEDDGRGMPVDAHPTEGAPAVEVILGRLHAGGKFSSKSYRYSGGLHGVGVSVVNALSTRMEVRIRRDGAEHTIAFSRGERIEPLERVGKTRKTGTRLHFWPDTDYFDSPRFSRARLEHLLRAKAVLCPELTVVLHDATGGAQQAPETLTWYYEDGLRDYLAGAVADVEHLPDPPFATRLGSEHEEMECALVWLPEGSGPAESYVNLIPTPLGGTHVNGLRTGVTEAIREFCDLHGLLPRGVRIAPEDVWEHIAYVLSVKMHEPQFAGQTKERLSSRSCATFVSGAVKDAFSLWLNEHTQSAEALVDLVVRAAQRRQRAAKKVTRKRVGSGPALPGKLADCQTRDPTEAELFVVEGDSAGGSAKQGRNRENQAILPLKGKILNVEKHRLDRILENDEIRALITAIGAGIGEEFDIEDARYNKIILMTDADVDGAHIRTLLLTLLYRHMKPLLEAGYVYAAQPPLYRVRYRGETYDAMTEAERDRIVEEKCDGNPDQVQRFKGLGEMNPDQLWDTTMDPENRILKQINIDDAAAADRMFNVLMGDAVEPRKQFIKEHATEAEWVDI